MDAVENQNSMKLIVFNKNQSIKLGECKLKVDVIEENLITFTLNNGQVIYSTFDRKILKRMNLMGIIDDRSKKHMIIVFSSKETCAKICNFIQNNKPAVRITDSVMEESEFNEKLFLPLVKSSHIDQNLELKVVIQDFLNYFNNSPDQKQKYMCLIAEISFFNPLSSDAANRDRSKTEGNPQKYGGSDDMSLIKADIDLEERTSSMAESMEIDFTGNRSGNEAAWISFDNDDVDDEPLGDISNSQMSQNRNSIAEESSYNLRNRTMNLSQFVNSDSYNEEENDSDNSDLDEASFAKKSENMTRYHEKTSSQNQCIRSPNYELFEKQWQGRIIKKMRVFIQSDKSLFYEFNWSQSKNNYYCSSCNCKFLIKVTAKLLKDDDGEYVKLGDKIHKCKPATNDSILCTNVGRPSKKALNIVHKPDFQITTIKTRMGNKQQCLTILDESTKKPISTYIYQTIHKKFVCYGCDSKNKHVYARILKNDDGEECAHLFNKHVCGGVRQKTTVKEAPKIVQESNFHITTIKTHMGNNRQCLTILDESTKKPISTYIYQPSKKIFQCNGCHSKNKSVYAKLIKNDDGKECAHLFNEHVCQMITSDL